MSNQCPKCMYHRDKIKVIETDPKTKKKWLISLCPECKYKSDIEEYKRPSRNSSPSYFHEAPREDFDESGEEDIN